MRAGILDNSRWRRSLNATSQHQSANHDSNEFGVKSRSFSPVVTRTYSFHRSLYEMRRDNCLVDTSECDGSS